MSTPPDASAENLPAVPPVEPISLLEARALGCLVEKELTTPEYYPLSLNALVNACNQKSNRDPMMSVTAREVEIALEGMRHRRMVALFSGADARVPKYKQTLDLVHPMECADRVVLCELLLRGPQTPGELRGRCDRMLPFPDVQAVEAALARLAGRAAGALVAKLPRQPGQKEPRWAQLLTGEPAAVAPAAEAAAGPLTVEMRLPPEVEARFAALENDVANLRAALGELRREFGLPPDPPPA